MLNGTRRYSSHRISTRQSITFTSTPLSVSWLSEATVQCSVLSRYASLYGTQKIQDRCGAGARPGSAPQTAATARPGRRSLAPGFPSTARLLASCATEVPGQLLGQVCGSMRHGTLTPWRTSHNGSSANQRRTVNSERGFVLGRSRTCGHPSLRQSSTSRELVDSPKASR